MNIPKWLLILSGLFVVILLTLFLWDEHLSVAHPINDQKVTNFFLTLAAIAAILTLVFVAGQLREMQQTKIAAVLPDIYPANARFELEYISIQLDGKEGIQPIPIDLYNSTSPLQVISNIGVGTAKAITAKWIYDPKEVYDLAKGHYLFFRHMKNGIITRINYLKAGSDEPIHLPLPYLICCGNALNVRRGSSGSDGIFGIKPKLQLNLQYQNIYDLKFDRTFNVEVAAYTDLVIFTFDQPT